MEKEFVHIKIREDIVDMLAEASANLGRARKRVAKMAGVSLAKVCVKPCHAQCGANSICYSVEVDEDMFGRR